MDKDKDRTEPKGACTPLPDEYCPGCAKERPADFEFIFAAEREGAIIFTAPCPRHALTYVKEALCR